MTSFKQVYSEWLTAADLGGVARQVTIASWEEGSVVDSRTGKDKKQVVLKFNGVKKPFGCNITNCRTIESILGTDQMEHWVGKRIVLFPTTTMVGPDMKDAIRVRAVEAQQIMNEQRLGQPQPLSTPPHIPQQSRHVAPTDPNYVQTSVNQMVRDFAPPDTAVRGNPEADWSGGDDDDDASIPF